MPPGQAPQNTDCSQSDAWLPLHLRPARPADICRGNRHTFLSAQALHPESPGQAEGGCRASTGLCLLSPPIFSATHCPTFPCLFVFLSVLMLKFFTRPILHARVPHVTRPPGHTCICSPPSSACGSAGPLPPPRHRPPVAAHCYLEARPFQSASLVVLCHDLRSSPLYLQLSSWS